MSKAKTPGLEDPPGAARPSSSAETTPGGEPRHAPSALPFAVGPGPGPAEDTRADHRHAPSIPPWMGDATQRSEQRWDHTSDEAPRFAAGDSRKPQLNKRVAGPLANDARRSSGFAPRGRGGVAGPGDAAPTTVTTPALAAPPTTPITAAARRASGDRAVAQQGDRLGAPADAAPPAPVAAQLLVVGSLDAQWLGLAALLLGATTLALPSAPGAGPLWQSLLGSVQVGWPAGMSITAGLTALSLLLLTVALSSGSLRAPAKAGAAPEAGGLFAAAAAALALVFRDAAAPGALPPALWPVRGELAGIPLAVWCGAIAGSMALIARGKDERGPRVVAAFAGCVVLVQGWLPLVWRGSTTVPVAAAFGASPTLAPAAMVEGSAQLASPAGVWAIALLGPLALAGLMSRRARQLAHGRLLDAIAVVALATPALALLLRGGGTVDATLGAATACLSVVLATAATVVATLQREPTRIDLDVATMWESLAMFVLLAAYALLKVHGGRYSATDEAIYFYAAKAWSEGLWPYHDFFFSHPPLHIALPAGIFAIMGYSWPVAKALSALATAGTGVVVWRIGRRWFGPAWGVAAATLFLLASETLKASTNLTGVNLTTLWMMLMLWAALRQRFFVAGLCGGAAIATGVYAIGALVTLLLLAAFAQVPDGEERPRSLAGRVLSMPAVQMVVGAALIAGTLHLLGSLVGGEQFLDGVYRYHMQKKVKVAGYVSLDHGPGALFANLFATLQAKDFLTTFYYHAAMLWLALLAPMAMIAELALRRAQARRTALVSLLPGGAGQRGAQPPDGGSKPPLGPTWLVCFHPRVMWQHPRDGGAAVIVWLVTWAMVAELAQLRERYDFYYLLLLPTAALSAAAWLRSVWVLLRASAGAGVEDADTVAPDQVAGGSKPAPSWALPAAAGLLVLAALWVPLDAAANRAVFPSEFRASGSSRGLGQRLDFAWLDSPGPQLLSDMGRGLFWRDWRIRGNLDSGIHHYMWSKKRWFSTAEAIAADIAANSRFHDTITGASTHAPMVALLAGRRMAFDHVDTNSKTFKTGVIKEAAFWERACKDNLRYIVAAPQSWFTPEAVQRNPTISRHFRLLREYRDPHLKHWRDEVLQLWERRGSEPCRYEGSGRASAAAPAAAAPAVVAPATSAAPTAGAPKPPVPTSAKGAAKGTQLRKSRASAPRAAP